MPEICAVILAHNALPTLERVIEAVRRQSLPVAELLVVDNASTDGTPDRVRQRFPQVQLVREDVNRGVGGGHNRGWRAALERGYPLLWSLEHDCIPEPGCLETLVQALHHHPDPASVGAVAPLQRPTRAERYRQVWVWRGARFTRPRLPGEFEAVFESRGITFNGPLIPATTLQRVGYLNEDLFLGHEDFEFSRRIRQAGLRILKSPSAVVQHDLLRSYKETTVLGHRLLFPYNSVMRDYYSRRNEIFLRRREQRRAWLVAQLLLRAPAKALVIALLLDRKISRFSALTLSLRDGWTANLGHKSYLFLTQSEPPTGAGRNETWRS